MMKSHPGKGPGVRLSGWRLAVVLVLAAVTAMAAPSAARLPQLLELGSGTCIPCKQMKPILEELGRDYAGQLQVVNIDVVANPAAAKSYRVRLIPTQVFLAADGRELFRHEGFFAKKEILAKWQELGIVLLAPPGTAPAR